MYKTKLFDEYCVEDKLAEFLNENKIPREQIISISMSSDSKAHARLGESSVDRILLVWEDGIEYKTRKERDEEREQMRREWEFQKKERERAWAQLENSMKQLQESLAKS